MPKITLTVTHEAGLHARPLAQFVKTTKAYEAEVKVTNLDRGKGPVNGASPVHLLMLAVLSGQQIEVEATGPQADDVLAALKSLVESTRAFSHFIIKRMPVDDQSRDEIVASLKQLLHEQTR